LPGADGRQFIFDEEIGEGPYREFLAPCQTWGILRSGGGQYNHRDATHETGHAVICIDEGLRAEYVTVIPKTVHDPTTGGERPRPGYCRYDYRLLQWFSTSPAAWGTNIAKINPAGQEAERIYLKGFGESVIQERQTFWDDDTRAAKKGVAASMGLNLERLEPGQLNDPEILSEVERLRGLVQTRLSDPAVWAAVEAVANRLVAEGAIDGRVVADLLVTEGAIDGHRVACLYSARVTSQ
jgi:hypothetical protein